MNGRFTAADLNYTLARLGHNRSVVTSRNLPNQRPFYSLTCRKTDLEQTMKTLTALIILAAAIVASPAQADSDPFKTLGQIGREQYGEEKDESFQWSFVLGRYQFIGRHPDSLRTYTALRRSTGRASNSLDPKDRRFADPCIRGGTSCRSGRGRCPVFQVGQERLDGNGVPCRQ